MKNWIKIEGRERRHKVIRKKIVGTKERPRLSVYRSLNHFYAQVIDDVDGKTLVSLSTLSPDVKDATKKDAGNVKGAAALGTALAEKCKKQGVTKVVFDRSGYLYHGRIKALADAARKGGLQF
jgi:large subunit ribosomal protein L18